MRALPRGVWSALTLCCSLLSTAHAAFITYENCLPSRVLNSSPKQLQFTPYFVDATFLPSDQSARNLNLTIYGNVSGQQFVGEYPPVDSPQWSNPNQSFGKIVDVGNDNKYATLTADYQVLTYTAHDNSGERFCPRVVNGTAECPLGPAFNANRSDPNDLPAFNVNQPFGSSYAFSTISTTVHVISGDQGGANIACISVHISPDLGASIAGLLTWLPATILILKGVATLAAAIWSPWGSSDIFKWSSNYGRDEDLLRLVTPGFGDCLQYIQFIVLTGSLTLQYPGFFRPAVSQAAWSTLMFNQSFVNGGSTESLVDGLYKVNATYGITRMSQLVGMADDSDIWAGMAIWLLVIAAVVIALCQLGFFGRWIFHLATNTTEEDLRQKNVPFTLGNIIRLLFNFFILPIVALSLFQLVIAPHSPTSVLVCAVILLVIMVVWAGCILRVIFTTKPRTLLFDDMPTVLLYGPLYNTYSDSAAPFALVPVFITFMRGVAFGAIQPSGIAQIIVLAICEVILILTLNGFRPFQGQTSMNLYHTFFATVRLITVLLMIAFMPSLGVTEAPKGWIGYVILLLHACVLIFGFFLNSMQTLIEVVARGLGAGGDENNGAVRGSILNWRALKKRPDRKKDPADRNSMMSSAAILETNPAYGTRSRSISASSQQLLNRMSGFENFSQGGENVSSPDPDLEGSTHLAQTTSHGRASMSGAKADGDGYYRAPRPRKATMETLGSAGLKTKGTGDFPYQDSPTGPGHARDASYDSNTFGSPAPAYLRNRADSNDETTRNEAANRTDYAVREVDQYYRGPALNEQATRKLKTGPADPTGPASTAQSWFNKLIFGVKGGKTKDQGKGFEVVRSARMPPDMAKEADDGLEMTTNPAMRQVPYQDMPDSPGSPPQAVAGAERYLDGAVERSMSPASPGLNAGTPTSAADMIALGPVPARADDSFDFQFGHPRDSAMSAATRVRPDSDALGMPVLEPITFEHADAIGVAPTPPRRLSDASEASRVSFPPDDTELPRTRYSDQPIPMLAPIETSPSIDLPSRFNSNASRFTANQQTHAGTLSPGQGVSRIGSNRSAGLSNVDIGETAGGQDWLHAVDNMSWGNHSREPSIRGGATGPAHQSVRQSFQRHPPSVPRRNSRRTLSQEVSAGQRYQLSQQPSPNLFEGFDSNGSTPDVDDRPRQGSTSKTSYVSHHRAQDSISRNSIGAAAALREGTASVEYGTPPTHGEDYLGAAERRL
ncbi:putative ML-like domain, transient receptor potential channel Flc/Pkd2 [Septoria linicola]|nr:putative ML-like domain, transient receptor potential channel Flc/Pkd2 [Septoria linicola]